MYNFNTSIFFARLTLLYITRIYQQNNGDDDFTEDLHTFLISYFLSSLDKYFSGVSTIPIINELCIWVSWKEELSLF